LGNKGQVAYAAAKRGLEGINATLMEETIARRLLHDQ
jgi:hypothetical protein